MKGELARQEARGVLHEGPAAAQRKLKVLDLFSGIGGFSLGLERTGGFETVAFCEIEEFPRRVLAKHWPGVPIHRDVRELKAEHVGAVDVICGGYPCQPFSLAGQRRGSEDDRHLWPEMRRLVDECRPAWVIGENVAGHISMGLDDVLSDLGSLGYACRPFVVPACALDAQHRRDRVWIVAHAERSGPQGAAGERMHCKGRPPVLIAAGGQVLANTFSERGCGRQAHGQDAEDAWQPSSYSRRWLWQPEPDVGGRFDGFPHWLVRFIGRGLSDAESARRSEVLRQLWSSHVARSLWRSTGGLDRFSQAQVLFSFVRQYEEGADEARLLVEGQEASEDFLRSLREREVARSAPRKSAQGGQSIGEYSDTLLAMSRLLARDSQADWQAHSWEDGLARVASGVPDRVRRLRGLGNAVVPQIPEIIGRAILASEGLVAGPPNGEAVSTTNPLSPRQPDREAGGTT